MSAHFYEHWLELRSQTQDDPDGLDRTTRFALSEAVDCIEDYLSDNDMEHIEAAEEYLRGVWPT